jgi:16S rRNA processing protein RimM
MKTRRVVPKDPQQGTGSPEPGEPVFVVVGKLRRPHGIKGEILMDVLTDFPDRLRRRQTVFVGEQHEPQVIETLRWSDRAILIGFAGFEDVDAVGQFRNQFVYRKVSDLPTLPVGEFYFHQLIGLQVVDEQGQDLGVLAEILETGANDVYVVKSPEGKEILLPALENVILNVDMEKREIRVRPPEWG